MERTQPREPRETLTYAFELSDSSDLARQRRGDFPEYSRSGVRDAAAAYFYSGTYCAIDVDCK